MESTLYEEPTPALPPPKNESSEKKTSSSSSSSWSLALSFLARSPNTKVKRNQVSAAESVTATVPKKQTQEDAKSAASNVDLKSEFEENERKLVASYDSIIASLKQEIDLAKEKELGYQKLIADVQLQKCNLEDTIAVKNKETQALNYDLQNAFSTCQQFGQQVMLLRQEYSMLESNFNQCLFERNRAQTVIQEYEFQISSLQTSASSYSTVSGSQTVDLERIAQLSAEIESISNERDNLRAQVEQYLKIGSPQQLPPMNAGSSNGFGQSIFEQNRNGFEDDERQVVRSNYEALIANIKLEIDEYKQKELKYQREMSDIQLQKCSFEADAKKKGEESEMVKSEYQLLCGRVQYLEEQLRQQSTSNYEMKANPAEEKFEIPVVNQSESANEAVIERMTREIGEFKEKEITFQQTIADLQFRLKDLQSEDSQREQELASSNSETQAVQEQQAALAQQLTQLQEEYRQMEFKFQESIEERSQILELKNESDRLCANLQTSVSRLSEDLSASARLAAGMKAEVERLNDENNKIVLESERFQSQLSSTTTTIANLQQSLSNSESIVAKKVEEVDVIQAEYARLLANARYVEQLTQMNYNYQYMDSTYSGQMMQMQQEYRNMEVRCYECVEERDKLQRQYNELKSSSTEATERMRREYNESLSRCEELKSSSSTLTAQVMELKAEIERLTNEKDSARREVEQLQSQLSKANSTIADLQQDVRKNESIASKKSDELAAMTSEYQTALNNARYMEEQLTQMNYNYQYMDSTYSGQMMQMQQEYRNMEVRCYECTEATERMRREYNESVSRCEELKSSTSTLTAQVMELKTEVSRVTAELSTAISSKSELTSLNSELTSQVRDLKMDIDRMSAEKGNINRDLEQLKIQLTTSKDALTECQQQLSISRSDHQAAISNCQSLEGQVNQVRQEYQYMENSYTMQIRQIQQEYINMESTHSAQMNQLKEEYATLESSYSTRMNHMNQEYGKLEYNYSQLQQNLVQMENMYKESMEERQKIDQRYNESEKRGITLRSTISSLSAELSATSPQVKELQAVIDRLLSEKCSSEERLQITFRQGKDFEQQCKNLQMEINSVQEQLQKEYQTKESMLIEYSHLQTELYVTVTNANAVRNEYNELIRRYETLRRDYDGAQFEISSLRKELEATEDRIRKYFTASQHSQSRSNLPHTLDRGIEFPQQPSENASKKTSSLITDNYLTEKQSEGSKGVATTSTLNEDVSQLALSSGEVNSYNNLGSFSTRAAVDGKNSNQLSNSHTNSDHNVISTHTGSSQIPDEHQPAAQVPEVKNFGGYNNMNFDSNSSYSVPNTQRVDNQAESSLLNYPSATVAEESRIQPAIIEEVGSTMGFYNSSSSFNVLVDQPFNGSNESRAPKHFVENPLHSNDLAATDSTPFQSSGFGAPAIFGSLSQSKRSANNSAKNLTQLEQESSIHGHSNHSQQLQKSLSQRSTGLQSEPFNTNPFASSSMPVEQPASFVTSNALYNTTGSYSNSSSFQATENPLRSNDFAAPESSPFQSSGFGAPNVSDWGNFGGLSQSKRSANNSAKNLAQSEQEISVHGHSNHSQQLLKSLSQKSTGLQSEPFNTNPFASSSMPVEQPAIFGTGNALGGMYNATGSYSNSSSFHAPADQPFNGSDGSSALQNLKSDLLPQSMLLQPNNSGTALGSFNQSDFGGLQSKIDSSLNMAQLDQSNSGKVDNIASDGSFSHGKSSEPTKKNQNLSIEYQEDDDLDELQNSGNFGPSSGLDSTRGSYAHSTSLNSPGDRLDQSANSNELEDSMDGHVMNGFSSLSVSMGNAEFSPAKQGDSFGQYFQPNTVLSSSGKSDGELAHLNNSFGSVMDAQTFGGSGLNTQSFSTFGHFFGGDVGSTKLSSNEEMFFSKSVQF